MIFRTFRGKVLHFLHYLIYIFIIYAIHLHLIKTLNCFFILNTFLNLTEASLIYGFDNIKITVHQ